MYVATNLLTKGIGESWILSLLPRIISNNWLVCTEGKMYEEDKPLKNIVEYAKTHIINFRFQLWKNESSWGSLRNENEGSYLLLSNIKIFSKTDWRKRILVHNFIISWLSNKFKSLNRRLYILTLFDFPELVVDWYSPVIFEHSIFEQ